jgi:plastocyanin
MRLLRAAVLGGFALVGACGGGGGGNGGGNPLQPAPTASVTVNDNVFSPGTVALTVNGTVTWTWNPANLNQHNVQFVASGTLPVPMNSTTQASGSYSASFTAAGRYDYFCNIHGGMTGVVVVN